MGNISEAICLAALVEAGEKVLIPFGCAERYDLAVDRDGHLVRIQVKTGRIKDSVVRFPTYSLNGFTRVKSAYHGEIDYFMIYCPDNRTIYWVSVDDCGPHSGNLRLEPALNNQVSGVKMASEYEYQGELAPTGRAGKS